MHTSVGEVMKPALLVIDLQRWFLEVGPAEKLGSSLKFPVKRS